MPAFKNLFYLSLSFIFIQSAFVHAENVTQLLQKCNQYLKANNLTSGRGGTALDCYQQVLTQEPENVKALAGLQEIENRYAKWAKRAVQRGQNTKVKKYLENIYKVNPNSTILAEFDEELRPIVAETVDKIVLKDAPKDVPKDDAKEQISTNLTTNEQTESKTIDNNITPEENQQQTLEPEVVETPKKIAKITDIKQIYESINITECLTWETPEIKAKSGKSSWGNFYPHHETTGIIIAQMEHCNLDDTIYLLQIDEYYIPISIHGIQIIEEELASENQDNES